MAQEDTLTLLVAAMCVHALTKGSVFGRTRLGSFFQDNWFQGAYGGDESPNKIIRPNFQRDFGEWKKDKKASFIHGILNGAIDLGHFIILALVPGETDKYWLLDGQHRLLTIQEFINNKFAIEVTDSEGKVMQTKYKKLSGELQTKLHNIFADVKIQVGLTYAQANIEYNNLNSAAPFTAPAKIHGLRGSIEGESPIYSYIDDIAHKLDNETQGRIRVLANINEKTTPQQLLKKLLPLVAGLGFGSDQVKTEKSKIETILTKPMPSDMDDRIAKFIEITKDLDSSKFTRTTDQVGQIVTDLFNHWSEADEIAKIGRRWRAYIRQTVLNGRTDIVDAMKNNRKNTNSPSKTELNAGCDRIRELAADGLLADE